MRHPSVLALAILLGTAGLARAQADFVGARAMGMGEAQRTIPTGASAVLLNPAGMSLMRQYVIEGIYGINIEQLGHQAHVSVTDSVTSRLAAGLFYTYINASPKLGFNWAGGMVPSAQLSRTGHATGLSLSIPIGNVVIIGANAKYLFIETSAPLPAGTVPPNLTFDKVNGVTFDIGLLLRLGEKVRIAAVGYNLWDHGSRETPLSLGLGLSYSPLPALVIAFDAVVNFTGYQSYRVDPMTQAIFLDSRVTARLGPGLEWLIGGKVPLRAGVVYDSGLPGTFLTAGLGYVSTQFGIDLGYRGKVQGGVENTLMVGIRLFIN